MSSLEPPSMSSLALAAVDVSDAAEQAPTAGRSLEAGQEWTALELAPAVPREGLSAWFQA